MSAPPQAEVRQEYFDNQPTDVEIEDTSSDIATKDPWDPDKIRIHTKPFSLRQVIDMIKDKDIDLAPDFQRQYVWKDAQRWGLIESIMLGIPLPSFYFNEDRSGMLQVVDGVQRLTTINLFATNQVLLQNMAYLKILEGQSYETLNGIHRRRFQQTQIVAHVIDPQTPYRLKFDIFKRINTGGSPLSAQEIRHCMSLERSRKFLSNLVNLPEFKEVMGYAVINNSRMNDREIALRLIAFRVLSLDDYDKYDSLDEFLGRVTEEIDLRLTDSHLAQLIDGAQLALTNAKAIFGEFAFRKWAFTDTRRNPINRTLVESWGTALANYPADKISRVADKIREGARRMMTSDTDFIDSINGSTGDPRKVKTRMTRVANCLAEVLK
jgi:hypothetical protein